MHFVKYSSFQSTRPARGATDRPAQRDRHTYISIHAPREGRDLALTNTPAIEGIFQSTRPARGATAVPSYSRFSRSLFQSTRPARGATANLHKKVVRFAKNIQDRPHIPSGPLCTGRRAEKITANTVVCAVRTRWENLRAFASRGAECLSGEAPLPAGMPAGKGGCFLI